MTKRTSAPLCWAPGPRATRLSEFLAAVMLICAAAVASVRAAYNIAKQSRKRTFAILGIVASVVAAAGTAKASVVVNETFTYANGDLVGDNPTVGTVWAAHSAPALTPVQVTSGQAVLAHGSGAREDVNIGLEGGAIGPGMVMYAGFDVSVTGPGSGLLSSFFAMFLDGTTDFASRVWVTAPTTSGYKIAFSNGGSIDSVWATDLNFGTSYRVVTSFNYDTSAASLWINPTSQASTSIAAVTGIQLPYTAYSFRQQSGNTTQTIDNLIVATTFNEAAQISSVPEASAFSFVGTILGVIGMWSLRKRRQRKAGLA